MWLQVDLLASVEEFPNLIQGLQQSHDHPPMILDPAPVQAHVSRTSGTPWHSDGGRTASGRPIRAVRFGRHRLFLRPEWIHEREECPIAVGVDISKTHLDAWAPAGKVTNDSAGFNARVDRPVRSTRPDLGPRLRGGAPASAGARAGAAFCAGDAAAKTDAVDARVLEMLLCGRRGVAAGAARPRCRATRWSRMTSCEARARRLSQIDIWLDVGKGLAEDVVGPPDRDPDSIPGVSSITAACLLTRMPDREEPGGSRAGHAPVFLAGPQLHPGRPTAGAAASYMPALAAIPCNPGLRAKYRESL